MSVQDWEIYDSLTPMTRMLIQNADAPPHMPTMQSYIDIYEAQFPKLSRQEREEMALEEATPPPKPFQKF